MRKISLKICGITNSQSVKTAYKNKIKSLGFESNNLNGPNTSSDEKIKILIKELKPPTITPWASILSFAYCEHVGSNLQFLPNKKLKYF